MTRSGRLNTYLHRRYMYHDFNV